MDFSKVIEENEVSVKPEELEESKALLLNKGVQDCVKPFFTNDAWLAVENTLKMLAGM